MEYTVSITPKWQIHIPKAIREELKWDKPGQATMRIRDQAVEIKPEEDLIFKMRGRYKGRKPIKPINLDKVRDYIDYSQW